MLVGKQFSKNLNVLILIQINSELTLIVIVLITTDRDIFYLFDLSSLASALLMKSLMTGSRLFVLSHTISIFLPQCILSFCWLTKQVCGYQVITHIHQLSIFFQSRWPVHLFDLLTPICKCYYLLRKFWFSQVSVSVNFLYYYTVACK